MIKIFNKIKQAYKKFKLNRQINKLLIAESASDRNFFESIFKNLQHILLDNNSGVSNDFLLRVNLLIIKRLLLLRDIIGIQPLQGPVGLIFSLTKENSSISLVKAAIEARSKKLQSKWCQESSLECFNQTGIDIESEIINFFSQSVAEEIVTEIIDDMCCNLSSNNIIYTSNNQLITSIIHTIKQQYCSEFTNFLIMSPETLQLLTTSPTVSIQYDSVSLDQCEKVNQLISNNIQPYTLFKAGYLIIDNLRFAVYLYSHFSTEEETILVGHKISDIGVGYIWCPYMPVIMTHAEIDSNTFVPYYNSIARYGKYFSHINDYYCKITYKKLLNSEIES